MNTAAEILNLDIKQYMFDVGQQARVASRIAAKASTNAKNQALLAIAEQLITEQSALLDANHQDLDAGKQNGLDDALMDRLALNKDRITGMAEGLCQIAALPDPVGAVDDMKTLPSGIQLGKMRVPLGVIGIIYESRPNVTADAAGLCLKSGNAAILRGGSEALHSNTAIANCITKGLQQTGLSETLVQVLRTADRAAVGELLNMPECVDVIIPRGGQGLIKRVAADSRVPVIKHLDGICHVYIDAEADLDKAFDIAFNAKTHRYGVCNAMETLLVHQSVAAQILPRLAEAYRKAGVELRGCGQSCVLVGDMQIATEQDWLTEYLAAILSIRIVDSLEQAIEHINHYGSQHTDTIVSQNISKAQQFLREVDSSSVMVNTSTRFADGFEYGLGAEIGISTDKLHVRGPVGLEGLTTQKYVVYGEGHIRS